MSDFDIDRIPEYMFHEAVHETLGGSKLAKVREGYNFRCPICGDSKKSPHKKKAYVYTDKWVFACWRKCGTMSFVSFLKKYHSEIYKKLIFHGFSHEQKKKEVKEEKDTSGSKIYKFKKGELLTLYDDNPTSKKALAYCKKRQINEKFYSKWFVCIKDEKFFDRDEKGNIKRDPEKGYPLGNEYGNRLIIPYYRLGGKWNQFDARALGDAFPKYKNLQAIDREMYNIDFLDPTKPFFLFEGSINSTFLKNSASFGGTKHLKQFLELHPELLQYCHNGVLMWDNDNAGYDELENNMKLGFNWFNWSTIKPLEEFKYDEDGGLRVIGDTNDMKMYGYTELDDDEYISYDFIKQFIEKSEGGLVKTHMLYGDRRKQKIKGFKDALQRKDPVRKKTYLSR